MGFVIFGFKLKMFLTITTVLGPFCTALTFYHLPCIAAISSTAKVKCSSVSYMILQIEQIGGKNSTVSTSKPWLQGEKGMDESGSQKTPVEYLIQT